MTPKLSIVAPVFNEEDCIGAFVEEMCGVLDGEGRPYELLCIDDGSTDATGQRLAALASRFPCLRAVALDRHHGQSAALWAGITMSRADLIALTDSDLQNDPRDLVSFARELEANQDWACVAGVRVNRRDPWLRRASSRLANAFVRAIIGLPFQDVGCATKVCRTNALRSVRFFDGAHRFISVLIALDGGVVVERPVGHRHRPGGASKYGLGRTFTAMRDALGVRWMRDRKMSFDASPIR
jgi:dolichol-phosphate mannosyltransferase